MANKANQLTRRQLVENQRVLFGRDKRGFADAVVQLFITEEARRGSFFLVANNDILFYNGETYRIIKFGGYKRLNEDFSTFFTLKYGLAPVEYTAKLVLSTLDAYAREHGKKPELHRFAYYGQERQALYLSGYNGQVLKLDGETFKWITNGSEVLFVDDDKGVEIEDDFPIAPHGQLFETLVDDIKFDEEAAGLSKESQKTLLAAWILSLPFLSIMPGPPILLLEGEKGSGKTTAIERIQLAVLGTTASMQLNNKSEKDFGVMLLRNPIALLDNVDSYISWLPNQIAAYCTGAGWTVRKLYSNDDEHEIKPRSHIAVSSRNPKSFRRDDVADRSIILRMKRRNGEFRNVNSLRKEILKKRKYLYGEWLTYINRMVKIFNQGGFHFNTTHRLSDFALICKVAEKACPEYIKNIDKALDELQHERDQMSIEADPIIPLLETWLRNTDNQGREVTSSELLKDLNQLAYMEGLTNPYKTPASLAAKIRNNKPALERFFVIKDDRKVRNYKVYQFFQREG